jgi:hypothetical protein
MHAHTLACTHTQVNQYMTPQHLHSSDQEANTFSKQLDHNYIVDVSIQAL